MRDITVITMRRLNEFSEFCNDESYTTLQSDIVPLPNDTVRK